MTHYTFKSCAQAEDQEEIIDLSYTLKDELYLPDRAVCQQITELCFQKGGVVGVNDGSQLIAMMGYFYGEPDCDYVNKDTTFLYVAGIRQAYRLTPIFHRGLIYSLQQFQNAGAVAIRLQAEAANPYTNRLYGRFARPLTRSRSLRGKEVVTYGGSIADALAYLRRRQRSSIQTPVPHKNFANNLPREGMSIASS
jgi:hypothetical protein